MRALFAPPQQCASQKGDVLEQSRDARQRTLTPKIFRHRHTERLARHDVKLDAMHRAGNDGSIGSPHTKWCIHVAALMRATAAFTPSGYAGVMLPSARDPSSITSVETSMDSEGTRGVANANDLETGREAQHAPQAERPA
jgi:hypothetical protein